jgi:glycosyltransferase involved in cell wall biosynthesis
MKTQKLAIISSYKTLCGNATYTEVLRQEFSKYYDVSVLSLNVKLLEMSHPKMVKEGNKHIQELAEQLAAFDFVNIQFEAGLFGTNKNVIFKRIRMLIKASKNIILTLHRFEMPISFEESIQNHYDVTSNNLLAAVFNAIIRLPRLNYYANLYKNIINLCKNQNAALMVHTQRDKFLIQNLFKYDRVYDHPITFLSQEAITDYKTRFDRTQFVNKYKLSDKNVFIGIFGFISRYKGHHVAVKAMELLPDNYQLLIFGSQHPTSIKPLSDIDGYINSVVETVRYGMPLDEIKEVNDYFKYLKQNSGANKVKFFGSLNDEDFITALLCCDVVVLPYMETGQSGSGIAALTLEAGTRAIFAQNYSSIELSRYAQNAFEFISIGNYIELANRIQSNDKPVRQEALNKYYKKYNISSNIALHRAIFENNI